VSKDALFSSRDIEFVTKRLAFVVCLMVSACFFVSRIEAADYQTSNFIIRNAPSFELARQFGQTAEKCRKELAILWLGEELQPWASPCPIFVRVGNFGAGGETSMRFDKAHLMDFEWDMKIQGPADAIITAVLPHEITHIILATHFKQPIPRWIDEGAATFVENEKERQNYRNLLYQYLRTGRGIPFNQMFRMTKYPDDQMPLYSQSFSLAEFLILQQGYRHYVEFAAVGMENNDWPQAIYEFYGYENLGELQNKWNRWVDAGCPDWTQLPIDEPIHVRNTTQYIASKDFMPTRPPLIFARVMPSNQVTTSDQRIMPVSWEPDSAMLVVASQPQREPLRMAVSQQNYSQPLMATLSPISESGKMVPYTSHNTTIAQNVYEAPQAIVAQPIPAQHVARNVAQPVAQPMTVAPTQMQESTSHWAGMGTAGANRTNERIQPEQQFYTPPQNTQTNATRDSRVIMDWNIR